MQALMLARERLENIQAERPRRRLSIELQTPLRVRRFKRIVEHLNSVEGIGVFALSRISPDGQFSQSPHCQDM